MCDDGVNTHFGTQYSDEVGQLAEKEVLCKHPSRATSASVGTPRPYPIPIQFFSCSPFTLMAVLVRSRS